MPSPAPDLSPPIPTTIALTGLVFADHNGDGLRAPDEPSLAGVGVCLDAPPDQDAANPGSGDHCTRSGADGVFSIPGAFQSADPAAHRLWLTSPSADPALAYRYVNRFLIWVDLPARHVGEHLAPAQSLPDTRLAPIDQPLEVEIQPGAPLEIGLTQGYLTDVLPCGVREKFHTYQAFDLDPRPGFIRHYYESEPRQDQPGRTVLPGDNHFAYDWGHTDTQIIGAPLLAPAGGIVVFAGVAEMPNGACRLVTLAHPGTGGTSGVVHLDTILVADRQEVLRGQVLGTLGQSCTTWPHVHFYFRPATIQGGADWEGIDPYRDTADPASYSYWTVDNAPHCPAVQMP